MKKANKRIKIMALYSFQEKDEIASILKQQSQDGKGKWENLELITEGNPDYYIILSQPKLKGRIQHHDPSRSIIFSYEPSIRRKIDKEYLCQRDPEYLKFCSYKDYLNLGIFWIGRSYRQLKKIKIRKNKNLSLITRAHHSFFKGHKKTINFIKFIEKKYPAFLNNLDIFGEHNNFGYKRYRGRIEKKYDGLFPYKYTLAIENSREKNYITEKLYDALLAECLCFYWGAPNVEDWIDPRALIEIDLSNFEKAYQTIKKAIENNEWEKRIKYIKKEKGKVLEKYNFFPMVQSVIKEIESRPIPKTIIWQKIKYYAVYRFIFFFLYPFFSPSNSFHKILNFLYKISANLKNRYKWYNSLLFIIKRSKRDIGAKKTDRLS